MIYKGKEYKIYEIYSKVGINKTDGIDNLTSDLLFEELKKQDIHFSRLEFKPFRKEIVDLHKGYNVASHKGEVPEKHFPDKQPDPNDNTHNGTLKSHQEEKHYCREMYKLYKSNESSKVDLRIGNIIDYEVPIKRCITGSKSDIAIGNIDLISETAEKVYLIEAKAMKSNEPILRAVLEVITYFNMISTKKIISDYSTEAYNSFQFRHNKHQVTPAIMLFDESNIYKEYCNLKKDSLEANLIRKYNIEFFILKAQEKYGLYELINE